MISEHGVRGMFVAPTALRAIKRQDPTAAEGKRHRMKRKATDQLSESDKGQFGREQTDKKNGTEN